MNIAIFGDVIIDEYIKGIVKRISPEAPVPIVNVQERTRLLGGAGNVYQNIKSIYENATLRTFAKDESTIPLKQRVIGNGKQIARMDFEGDVEWIHDYSNVNDSLVVFSDYNKGAFDCFDRTILTNNQCIVDPKRSLDFFKGVWCVKPNKVEFEMSEGVCNNVSELESAMKKASQRYSIENLIVTLGDEGVAYVSDNEFVLVKAEKVEVSDVTGAGDTFTAVLAYAVASGIPFDYAVVLANRAAAVSVTHAGCYVVKRSDLEMNETVFTNGCFDCLHVGHIQYLKKSKELGSRLVVGINSDNSVRSIKGETRPIFNENERKAMLESLGFIDEVIIFDEPTPLEVIKKVNPKIITKGSDYAKEDVVGYGLANVVIVPIELSVSTSNIIERIKNAT